MSGTWWKISFLGVCLLRICGCGYSTHSGEHSVQGTGFRTEGMLPLGTTAMSKRLSKSCIRVAWFPWQSSFLFHPLTATTRIRKRSVSLQGSGAKLVCWWRRDPGWEMEISVLQAPSGSRDFRPQSPAYPSDWGAKCQVMMQQEDHQRNCSCEVKCIQQTGAFLSRNLRRKHYVVLKNRSLSRLLPIHKKRVKRQVLKGTRVGQSFYLT